MRYFKVSRQILLTFIISQVHERPIFAVVTESVVSGEKYAIISVNDERKQIENDKILQVIWGDKIKLHPTELAEKDVHIFIEDEQAKKAKPLILPRTNLVIETAQDLSRSQAQEVSGVRRFAVKYMSGKQTILTWHLEVVIPEFRYAIVEINGREFVLRDKLGLKVRKSDKFKIKRLVTNLGELDRTIEYAVVPEASITGSSSDSVYSIQLSRYKRVFATVPMEVVE